MLAAIPLLGFLANGTAFITGQAEVENAFASVSTPTTLAETSQDLKAALSGMRIVVRDFAAQPSTALVQSFEDIHQAVTQQPAPNRRQRATPSVRRRDRRPAQAHCRAERPIFHLTNEQKALGFSEDEGIRRRMRGCRDRGRAHHQRGDVVADQDRRAEGC